MPKIALRAGKRCLLAASASLALVLSGCSGSGGSDDSVTFIFASSGTPTQGISQEFKWYMDEVSERSDGRIKWEEHWAGALLPSGELASGVADGRADASFFATPYDQASFPLFHLGYVPMQEINAIGATNAWRDMAENSDLLKEEFDKAGVVPLVFAGVSNAATISAPDRLSTLADLDKMKIRFAGPITEAISDTTGADPISLNAEDLYPGMETGVIDAIGGYAVDSLVGSGLHEVAPVVHTLATGYYSSSISLLLNKDRWDGLDQELKDIMLEVQDEYYEELPSKLMDFEADACKVLEEQGGGMVNFPADKAEADKWIASIGTSLVDTWATAATKSGLSGADVNAFAEDYRAAAEKYSAETEYVPGAEACIAGSNLK